MKFGKIMDISTLVISKADEEWEKGNHQVAFKLFQEGASKGIYECKNRLGICYECGMGVKKNFKKAIYWYKRAIKEDKSSTSMQNLADLYKKTKNISRAKYWYQRAIKSGDIGGPSLDLAKVYLDAKSNKHNLKMARHFLGVTLKCKPSHAISQNDYDEAKQLWAQHFSRVNE